jgi:hypothetical protein
MFYLRHDRSFVGAWFNIRYNQDESRAPFAYRTIAMQKTTDPMNRSAQRPRGLRLHADDNVAVVLGDVQPEPLEILGLIGAAVVVKEAVTQGHKISLRPIAEGEAVIKCGVAIGYATAPIAAGAWVHTHNCRSGLDERSHTLDPHSGAPTDTRYV